MANREIKMREAWFRHAEGSGNVARTCRYFGISRKTFYKWLIRLEDDGPLGLRDRPRRPRRSPNATPQDVVEKILHLRRSYHYGPMKIRMYLKRYHAITKSQATIWRILRQAGLGRLPENMRYKRHALRFQRYEKALPGQQIQLDVKFVSPIAGRDRRYYQYSAADDCTRLRILKIYEQNNQQSSMDFVDYVLSKLPFTVDCIQTDNGPEFGEQFRWHVVDKGIAHRHIRPRTPRLNGKVERSHRIDAEEFYRQLEGVEISGAEELDRRLQEWERFYNYERPHGALDGQTPYERLRDKLKAQATVTSD